jgi:hypothetical protein
MKSKKQLFASIFQLAVGALAIVLFAILGLGGEGMTKWTITLILAGIYVVWGIVGIIDYALKR